MKIREKIEQLKSTAVQLANAAMETEGFVNTEESGRRLALEFWQGLEYMCRESEEAAIKNIFLNHFLDRLRESRPAQPTAIDSPQDAEQRDSVLVDNEPKPEDEFLGDVAQQSNRNVIEFLSQKKGKPRQKPKQSGILNQEQFDSLEI